MGIPGYIRKKTYILVNTIFRNICSIIWGRNYWDIRETHFWISCTGSKLLFCQNWKIAKLALLNPCMKFKISFGQKTSFEASWKNHHQKISLTCPRVHQIQDLGQLKYKTEIFSKGLTRFQTFFSIWVPMN
jgi:uncharacterized Fe-S radical SAM superfamily protein PflX